MRTYILRKLESRSSEKWRLILYSCGILVCSYSKCTSALIMHFSRCLYFMLVCACGVCTFGWNRKLVSFTVLKICWERHSCCIIVILWYYIVWDWILKFWCRNLRDERTLIIDTCMETVSLIHDLILALLCQIVQYIQSWVCGYFKNNLNLMLMIKIIISLCWSGVVHFYVWHECCQIRAIQLFICELCIIYSQLTNRQLCCAKCHGKHKFDDNFVKLWMCNKCCEQ